MTEISESNILTCYETVYSVSDYWDQPREGVADYNQQPHYYKCIFDEEKDEWSNLYFLKPLDIETFQLALESWDIWLRWETALQIGETTLASHPALHKDQERYKDITTVLAKKLIINLIKDIRAKAEFKRSSKSNTENKTLPYHMAWTVKWEVI